MSHTKRTSYDPNDLFPTTKSTYLIAKEDKGVLLVSEIGVDSKTNNAENYVFMAGEFQITKESNLENLIGFMQYRLKPNIPITLSKTKSEPSETR